MPAYSIHSTTTGLHLGTYEADSREAALDAMARDAGYTDYDHACRATCDTLPDLEVTEIVEITPDA
jgi:hypothetical protein